LHGFLSVQQEQLATQTDVSALRTGVKMCSHHALHGGTLRALIVQLTGKPLHQAVTDARRPRQHLVAMSPNTNSNQLSLDCSSTTGHM